MRTLALATTLVLLAACSQAGGPAAADSAALVVPSPARGELANAVAAAADASASPSAAAAISIPMLAYSYAYALEAPAKAIRAMVTRHESSCEAAGPTVCQIIGARVTEVGEDRLRGELTLRGTPAWVSRFRAGLEGEAKGASGRIVRATVDSEDLSRQIVDTEAALRARSTLRDRLQALLASRPGKLSELLEVEQELARVQGEIDATRSALTVMRGRVATSEVKLVYESAGVLAPDGGFAPVRAAVSDIADILAATLAVMIRAAAVLVPWGILVGGVVWLLRRQMLVRRKRDKAQPEAA